MRTDLRVRSTHYGDTVCIDVRHPSEKLHIKGVDIAADQFGDDASVAHAIGVLNATIKRWPNEPVTLEQVRALANG